MERGIHPITDAGATGRFHNDLRNLAYPLFESPLMTLRLRLPTLLALCACSSLSTANDWLVPQTPFALYGNTYYVGTKGISAVLLTSPAGHILIDSGPDGAADLVAANIEKLGFRIGDVRYILSTHEHDDHAGAIARLQQRSGATVLAGQSAAEVLRSGQPDRGDPQIDDLVAMQPVQNVRAVHDGEVVTLGPIRVTAHATPGHTKGGTSWSWKAQEANRTVNMVFADSLNAVSSDTRSFSNNPGYPKAVADLTASIARVASLPCDILISAHPDFSNLAQRRANQDKAGNAAFIDPQGCLRYAANARARLASKLELETRPPGDGQ